MEGWIKLHRKIQDHWLWSERRKFSKFEAWIYLLLQANHKNTKTIINGNVLQIMKGSFITSIVKLAEKWCWDRKTVTKFLITLENEKMITRKSTTEWTSISIENWELYQNIEQQSGQHNGQQDGQGMDSGLDTDKNEKNDKNVNTKLNEFNLYNNFDENLQCDCISKSTKKQCERRSTYNINGRNYCNQHSKSIISKYLGKQDKTLEDILRGNEFSKELEDTIRDFIDMRKTINKPMTAKALELLLKNLEGLTNLEAEKIAILNQSIEHCWQTVYPLKNKETVSETNKYDYKGDDTL